jgi:hypothetical protein
MWQLKSEQENKRIYTNPATGSECSQTMCYTDKDGNKWYSFDDLTSIPYTRNFAATKISSLYSLGLSKDDLSNHVTGLKTILKSADKDKYEKAYAIVLDFESKASNATDAVKQMSSLVCVYFTMNDEPIDSFDNGLQIKKMSLMEADIDMHGFFLTKQIELTERYLTFSNLISQIASVKPNELSVLSE